MITITLSEQDLSEFLEGNQGYIDAYANELQHRVSDYFGLDTTVNVDSNALTDKFNINGEVDEGEIAHIMNEMVNDWEWLPAQ